MLVLSRRKRILFGAIIASAALLFALSVAEVSLRMADRRWRQHFDNQGWLGRVTRAAANPRLVWEYAPHAVSEERWGPISTNAYGFRDRDLTSRSKPAGVTRIACIGDSVTLGMCVPEQEIFTRRVEALLRGAHGRRDVEVLNFSVDGYDALQVAELLADKVVPFQPDLVVYALCLNDFDRELSSGKKMRYFRPPRSFVLDAIARAAAAVRARAQGYHRYVFGRNRHAVYDAIRDMRANTADIGAGFCVAVVPLFPIEALLPAFSTEPRGTLRDYPGPWAAIRDDVVAFLAREGIDALDLVPAFADVDDAVDVAVDIWHPNGAGHARIAAALAPFLAARL